MCRRRRWWLCTCSVSPCRPPASRQVVLQNFASRRQSPVAVTCRLSCRAAAKSTATFQRNSTQHNTTAESLYSSQMQKKLHIRRLRSGQTHRGQTVCEGTVDRVGLVLLFFFQSAFTKSCDRKLFCTSPRLVPLPLCSPCINDSLTQNEEYYLRTRTAINPLWFELKSPSGFFSLSLVVHLLQPFFQMHSAGFISTAFHGSLSFVMDTVDRLMAELQGLTQIYGQALIVFFMLSTKLP